MDPMKRSPAKKTKSTETADTTTYQVDGELTNKECGINGCPGLLFEGVTFRGVVWYSCNQNVPGDANSCPERDSAKQTRLICVVCLLPVNGSIFHRDKARRGTNWTTRKSRVSCVQKIIILCTKNSNKTFCFSSFFSPL